MRSSNGFSVIELLLVCSIIGMLTMVLLPNIKNVRMRTKEMSMKSTVFKLQTLLESYYFDKGSYVAGEELDAGEIYAVFKNEGYVKKIPKNPYTGVPFSSSDKLGIIIYEKRDVDYLITAYKTDGTVLVQVDGG